MIGHWILREPPLVPSDDEAREWATRELAKAIYHQGPTFWQRLIEWIEDLWEALIRSNQSLGPILLPVIILVVVAVIVGIALLVGGPARRRRLRGATASAELLDDDSRTSEQIRAAADAAAADGDFALAVLERFRAIVRSLDERAVLEDRRGRTAHEAATAAGARLAPCAADLLRASELFDGVCYGDVVPDSTQDGWLREVDKDVKRTKPSRTGDLSEGELVAPR